jgi:hypothetical protein
MSDQRPAPPIPQAHRPQQQQGLPKIAPMPVQPVRQNDPNLEPLSLVDDSAASEVRAAPTAPKPAAAAPAAANPVLGPNASKIQAFGVAQSRAHLTKFNRPTTVNGFGACRVRTFHGRLSDEGLAYMDDKINEWLDTHPDIEIKFCTSTVGQYDGKIKEPALIVNVWF